MLYWFAKLKRRTFRHQLVMLLIVSDFLKACSELIYPAATIVSGDTKSGPLCTATGYFSTVFVSSTDAAVLIIALHTALSIFRPQSGANAEESGLYRHRYFVYAGWLVWSFLLPSLAFLNKQQAYTSSVSWCFLPIRPFYWRISLSWGPRYVILLFILFLYLSIYIYVIRKFKSFSDIFAKSGLDEDSSEMSHSFSTYNMREVNATDSGLVAELATHNLIEHDDEKAPAPSSSDSASNSPHTETIEPNYGRKASIISITLPAQLESRRASVMSLGRGTGTFTRYTNKGDASPETSVHKVPHQPSRPADPLRAQRRLIVKQLKHLFIFPIVYFFMWIIPFAFHMTQYHEKFVGKPVFELAAFAAFIIPLHGLVDVIVYARAERPWRSWRFREGAPRRSVAPVPAQSVNADEQVMPDKQRRHGATNWWDLEEEDE